MDSLRYRYRTFLLRVSDRGQWYLRQYINEDQYMASVARVIRYTEIPTEADLQIRGDESLQDTQWPSQGNIEFNNVFMKYRANMDHVIRGLSLNVSSGQKIGCVGRTGAGKSSIIQLLFRMVEIDRKFAPDSYVKIDGVDALTVGLHTLRNKISIIPQTPFVFSGTIKRNLDPFYKTSDEEMWRVLEDVNLKTSVEQLPGKLESDMSNATSISVLVKSS